MDEDEDEYAPDPNAPKTTQEEDEELLESREAIQEEEGNTPAVQKYAEAVKEVARAI